MDLTSPRVAETCPTIINSTNNLHNKPTQINSSSTTHTASPPVAAAAAYPSAAATLTVHMLNGQQVTHMLAAVTELTDAAAVNNEVASSNSNSSNQS